MFKGQLLTENNICEGVVYISGGKSDPLDEDKWKVYFVGDGVFKSACLSDGYRFTLELNKLSKCNNRRTIVSHPKDKEKVIHKGKPLTEDNIKVGVKYNTHGGRIKEVVYTSSGDYVVEGGDGGLTCFSLRFLYDHGIRTITYHPDDPQFEFKEGKKYRKGGCMDGPTYVGTFNNELVFKYDVNPHNKANVIMCSEEEAYNIFSPCF